nr:hypothetical protein [Pedobacter panaciterrae]
MKNFIKISLIAVLLINSVGLYASEGGFSIKLKNVNEKSVTFFINETQVVEVSIYEANDEVVYRKKINALKGSTKTYDLNSLPDGSYRFELKTESNNVEYKVQLKDGKASVSDPLIVDVVRPVLTKENGIVTLNFENAPEGPVEIQILDRYNDAVYERVFEGDAKFVKKFDVARDLKELTFIIRSANQVITKTVQMY